MLRLPVMVYETPGLTVPGSRLRISLFFSLSHVIILYATNLHHLWQLFIAPKFFGVLFFRWCINILETLVSTHPMMSIPVFGKGKTDMTSVDMDKSAREKADKPATDTADKLQERRHKLLALVHIAKQQIPLSDAEYRDVIAYWGVGSSADMSIAELEELVTYFESLGFKKKMTDPRDPGPGTGQVRALQERVRKEALKLNNGEERLKGLVKKIAKQNDLRSCRNMKKLKQLLKVIRLLQNRENR
jgi:hypothetical protein